MSSGALVQNLYVSETISATYRGGASDYVLICFGGAGIKAPQEEEANRGFVEKSGLRAVFITPRWRRWYPRAETEPCLRAVREFLGDAETVTYGASMGGYAAIKYARDVDARHVVALVPQFSIDPAAVRNRTDIYTSQFDPAFNAGMDIRPADAACPVDILFDPTHANDREHYELIRRRIPCRAVPVRYAGHGVEGLLSGGTDLADIVEALRADRPAAVTRLMRDRKRTSVLFHLSLFRSTIDKKPGFAAWALDKALSLPPLGLLDLRSRAEALVVVGRGREAERQVLAAYGAARRLTAKCSFALQLAEIYEALDSPAESLRWLNEAQGYSPDDDIIRLRLALALTRQGELEAAEPLLRRLIERIEMPGAWFGMSQLEAARGALDLAIGHGLRASVAMPNNSHWRSRLVDLLVRAGREAEAEGLCAGAVRLVGDAGAWGEWSRFLRLRERLPEALVAARRAVDLRPSDGAARAQLAHCLRESGRAQEALDICRRSARLWPWQAAAFVQLALSEEGCGDIDAAIASARRACEAEPDAAAHRVALIDILLRNDRAGEALAALAEAEAALRAPGVDLLAAAARARAQAGDLDGAIASISSAILRAPGTQAFHGLLASYLVRRKRFGEAVDAARRAEQLGPSPLWIGRALIGALEGAGDREGAISTCRAALAARPQAEDLHARLVQLLVGAGRPAEAAQVASQALADGVASAFLHAEHAKALAETGKLDEAVASARLATELAPDRAGLWGSLAQVLLKARRFEECEAAARRGLELRPDAGWIATLARRAAAGA